MFGTTQLLNLINQKDKKMSKKFVIKAQLGVTYECYMGFSDGSGARARRGQRYAVVGEYTDYYSVLPVSGFGYSKMIRKEKFASHFVPVNPIECCVE